MKSYLSNPHNFQTASVIRVKSNWLAMTLGFIGWVILLICSIGLYILVNRYLRFNEEFNEGGIWMYLLIAIPALLFGMWKASAFLWCRLPANRFLSPFTICWSAGPD